MALENIVIRGAKENNLKNIDLVLPKNKLIVMTGLSGSGKSSLAFDTLYAEGQRRYMESLSSYARMFMGQMEKPDVESVDGLSPAISIDQKTTAKNPRSTVGTVTEIYDYLRLMYARIGIPHCPDCGREIQRQSTDQMVDDIMKLPEKTRLRLLAPMVRGRKGEFVKLFERLRADGYVRVIVDGEQRELDEEIKLEKNIKHTVSVVVDRLIIRPGIESRLSASVETALKLGEGLVVAMTDEGEKLYSANYACPDCGTAIEELTPRLFSFNNPMGACPSCHGLGELYEVDPDLVIPDRSLSLRQGAVKVIGFNVNNGMDGWFTDIVRTLGAMYGFDLDTPVQAWSEAGLNAVLYGVEGKLQVGHVNRSDVFRSYEATWEGIIPLISRRSSETTSEPMKEYYEGLMRHRPCESCHGKRLKPAALAVTVGGKNIAELTDLSVRDALAFVNGLQLTQREELIAHEILKEVRARLSFLAEVGLSYLTLSRSAGTLSGGEAQRIRLATQIGSGLTGVLYILDEPSIGLHQRDNGKLIGTLKALRDLGNTVIVVEHDEETMLSADYLVDIGPGAGAHGGEIVACGTPQEVMANENSLTGRYLSGKLSIPVPERRREGNGKLLTVLGAHKNNLHGVNVSFPLGKFICVTGVSGSGKSTLVNYILCGAVSRKFSRLGRKNEALGFEGCEDVPGIENIDKLICIDQSPIGRTPRSNPATYTGVFDMIRELFAQTADAKARGFGKGRFSFNVKGGRCENCQGDGITRIEMHFLPDVYVPCEVCHGKRYNRETLEVRFKGKTISDVLDMTVAEAVEFFENIPAIKRKLQTLYDVGLTYITLGQPSTTLSGGEAQRIKLATELSRRSTGKTLYVLDEPTTGLHSDDVKKLINMLDRLTDDGNTVLVIEHNLDVIKCADHIIDLGPEGGDGGGNIVAEGTPEQVAECAESFTGQYLKPLLVRE